MDPINENLRLGIGISTVNSSSIGNIHTINAVAGEIIGIPNEDPTSNKPLTNRKVVVRVNQDPNVSSVFAKLQ